MLTVHNSSPNGQQEKTWVNVSIFLFIWGQIPRGGTNIQEINILVIYLHHIHAPAGSMQMLASCLRMWEYFQTGGNALGGCCIMGDGETGLLIDRSDCCGTNQLFPWRHCCRCYMLYLWIDLFWCTLRQISAWWASFCYFAIFFDLISKL